MSTFKKSNFSLNSYILNSNNKSTNASNNTFTNNLSFRNLTSNENQVRKIANNINNLSHNQILLGFSKNINDDNKEKKDMNSNNNSNNNYQEVNNNNNNFAKIKQRSGINAKLNYNVANIQKLKKEKSKKKISKTKPELINRFFDKLTEKVIKSDKNNENLILQKESSKLSNLNLITSDLNFTNNYQNDLLKDNLRQKGMDEYFEKINQDTSVDYLLKKEFVVTQKHQLKDLINDNFYIKRKYNKTPENSEIPKFSKRKNREENKTQEHEEQTKGNIQEHSNNGNLEFANKGKYSEKRYALLKLKKRNFRSISEEHPGQLSFLSQLRKNSDGFNELKVLSKSPIASHNRCNREEVNIGFTASNNSLININNDDKENNLSSGDEVLAYSTPTKIQMNRNLRKASKDKDQLIKKGKTTQD